MADAVGGPRTSRQVTIEDAARYDGDPAAVVALAGDRADAAGPPLIVLAANGAWLPVNRGDVVVKYGPDDLGVMDDGEYRRWFG